jgi:hypothetical protein
VIEIPVFLKADIVFGALSSSFYHMLALQRREKNLPCFNFQEMTGDLDMSFQMGYFGKLLTVPPIGEIP